jgi:hypothetical protein
VLANRNRIETVYQWIKTIDMKRNFFVRVCENGWDVQANDKWYNIQDLYVEEAMPQVIALSEAYIQIYERHSSQQNPNLIDNNNTVINGNNNNSNNNNNNSNNSINTTSPKSE